MRNETNTAGAWVEEIERGGSLSSAFLLWVMLIGWWPPESPQPLVLGEYFRKLKLNVKEKLQYFEQKDHNTESSGPLGAYFLINNITFV